MTTPVQAKRDYLRELVKAKNNWTRPLTTEEKALGFLGWHERGYFPHCDYSGLTQFVTFRLCDSMPSSRKGEWKHLLTLEDVREKRSKLENYLDRCVGKCWLRDPYVAKLTEQALMHFHGEHYELVAWCIMPNHVHVLVRVLQMPLGKMVKAWKQFIALNANGAMPGRRPALRMREVRWQREYWDTFMRDEEQVKKAIRYIEANPVKAKLVREQGEWIFSSLRRRDMYSRLCL